jgi:F-type H+-transporting ATPase subunit delta
MRGSSRTSLAAATDRVEPLLGTPEAAGLGEELFAVARLFDSSARLRRAVTDPSRDAGAKADLVGRLLTGKVSGTAVDVVSGMARDRWSAGRDIADACERLGALAVVASAQSDGNLDALEDELFRFGRIVDGDPALRRAMDDRALPAEGKAQLVERLLAGKVTPQTLVLARQATAYPRGRRMEAVLAEFGEVAAARRHRLVATVQSAVPLTESQRQRLSSALTRIYGQTMHLDVEVDPEVMGGLRIQVGDEVIDASVVTRLDEARRRLAG